MIKEAQTKKVSIKTFLKINHEEFTDLFWKGAK